MLSPMVLLPYVAMLGGAIGSGEVLVILLVALVVLGPQKLPAIARTLGRLLTDIQRSAREFAEELTRAADERHDASPSSSPKSRSPQARLANKPGE